jgi:small subunit ribosomal protein S19e
MTTPYDIPANDLIEGIAKKLEKDANIEIPKENIFSKTGVDRESPPTNKNWWYIRCAAILRKVYIKNNMGVERMAEEFGGKLDRGSKPHRARAGSGTIARRAFQQLEKAGYLTKIKGKGRILSPKGRSFMDNTSKEVVDGIKKYYPGLEKY